MKPLKRGVKLCLKFFALGCVVAVLVWLGATWASGNVDEIGAEAPSYLRSQGFEVVGRDGHQWGNWGGTVYYRVVCPSDPARHLYGLGVSKWGDEYQIWNMKCLDCCSGIR